jgi:hypothetical protein
MTALPDVPPGVDPTRPSPVRIYDYFLGGTHSFPVDRETAERLMATVPDVLDAMLANRGFHGRAATWIAGQGVRQFIDIGAGLPTRNNTHQAVHKVAPDARVVYVDNDPMVAAYSGPLRSPDGTSMLITADWRDPGAVLGDLGLRRFIDLAHPAGMLITTVVNFVPDDEDPWGLVSRYMEAAAPGSYLALSHGTYDKIPPGMVRAGREALADVRETVHLRTRAEVERFFDGLELVPPYPGAGRVITYAGLWGAEDIEVADTEGSRGIYCGVARRP